MAVVGKPKLVLIR